MAATLIWCFFQNLPCESAGRMEWTKICKHHHLCLLLWQTPTLITKVSSEKSNPKRKSPATNSQRVWHLTHRHYIGQDRWDRTGGWLLFTRGREGLSSFPAAIRLSLTQERTAWRATKAGAGDRLYTAELNRLSLYGRVEQDTLRPDPTRRWTSPFTIFLLGVLRSSLVAGSWVWASVIINIYIMVMQH